MTNEERMLIADILRQRIIEITKLFQEPGAHVPQENVPHAMKVQILLLAQALDHGFAKQDSAFDEVFVETVRGEINRSEGRPEQQSQEAESNPLDKLWGASVSEDGFVVPVDPSDMKSVYRMGRERQAAAQAVGSIGGAIGLGAYKSVCSPGADVTAIWYRVSMLSHCDDMGLLPRYKRDGDWVFCSNPSLADR